MSKIEVIFPESSKLFIDLQANNDFNIYTDPPYISVVEERLLQLKPKTCLEIGAGIGRMSVYFYKNFYDQALFYLQDGDCGSTQYGGIRDKSEGEYYNSFEATQDFCTANGLTNFKLVQNLTDIDQPIDFCYSFASIGFHWHCNLSKYKLPPLLADGATVMFELRAPLQAEDEVSDEKRHEYQQFYDSQIMAARNNLAYEDVEVIDLSSYRGYFYKAPTHFLLMRKRISTTK